MFEAHHMDLMYRPHVSFGPSPAVRDWHVQVRPTPGSESHAPSTAWFGSDQNGYCSRFSKHIWPNSKATDTGRLQADKAWLDV